MGLIQIDDSLVAIQAFAASDLAQSQSVRIGAGGSMHTTGLTWTDLNDGFVVAIHIEAKSGEAETVAALLADLVAPTMAEPGVKLFIPYRSPTSPAMFFVFEPFRSFRMQCRHDRFAPINRRFCALVYLSRSGRPSVSG